MAWNWNTYKPTSTFKPRPTHHLNDTASSFTNPWPQALFAATSLLRLPFVRAEPFDRPDIKPTETVKPDWSLYATPQDDGLRFTWLGHAVRHVYSDPHLLIDVDFMGAGWLSRRAF